MKEVDRISVKARVLIDEPRVPSVVDLYPAPISLSVSATTCSA